MMLGVLYHFGREMIRRPSNWAANRIDTPVLVLLYHRITRLQQDPQRLAVDPERFRAQLMHLKAHYEILRFEADWTALRHPSVVITFDDGYADTCLEALPILEELGVPATFFISTGTIGTDREFWWDELERLILCPVQLPDAFDLRTARGPVRWSTRTSRERRAFYVDLHRRMKRVAPQARDGWLEELRSWSGAGPAGRISHRALSLDELRRLAASPLVTVGAHTVTHSRLSSLAQDAQRTEIRQSRADLKSWIGREIEVFSYPFGGWLDYDRKSVSICRELGFTRVAANVTGQAHSWTSRFEIPRQLIRNWPAPEFSARLGRMWT
jgi:peptidoglycan/xylan/chitin deacetylase (PgdA/CDA1 family)